MSAMLYIRPTSNVCILIVFISTGLLIVADKKMTQPGTAEMQNIRG